MCFLGRLAGHVQGTSTIVEKGFDDLIKKFQVHALRDEHYELAGHRNLGVRFALRVNCQAVGKEMGHPLYLAAKRIWEWWPVKLALALEANGARP